MCGSQSHKARIYRYSIQQFRNFETSPHRLSLCSKYARFRLSRISISNMIFVLFKCASSSLLVGFFFRSFVAHISVAAVQPAYPAIVGAGLALLVCYYPSAAPFSNGYPASFVAARRWLFFCFVIHETHWLFVQLLIRVAKVESRKQEAYKHMSPICNNNNTYA